ncbi:MAG: bifunctional glutamate N-acetyltransferase/amino-acid acetyltransferase ArgJ [Thiogranum sp.]|nr:bifunctional glutamate N-acetyltransferase/amino-acid acetyltransferase ArgJ [Thiogranum sp.]
MPVGHTALCDLLPVKGVKLAAVAAGIRYQGRNDLVLFELAEHSCCAAVFTRNAFCAAPVTVARQHLAAQTPRYLLVNSGNANAGIGETGLADARKTCSLLAQSTGCDAQQVLPFSTGVIGERLPVDKIDAALGNAIAALSEDGWNAAARAIMTTDTVAKGVSRRIELEGCQVVITGIAKGSGMIRPDMATMLAYVATDANVESGALQSCLNRATERSFNRITVDGDTSTNDACVLVATGVAGNPVVTVDSGVYAQFCDAVSEICLQLAHLIVRDAEGATKFITVRVESGRDATECLQIAYTVAHSPLVKTALFASDPNWGRILAAIGRAGIPDLDVSRVHIYLDEVCIVRDGGRAAEYREQDGQRVMDKDEILIRILLGRGGAAETVWTCDLSHEYVRINAEYRS